MKTLKKLTAILLSVATLTTLFIQPAAAADSANTFTAETACLADGDHLCVAECKDAAEEALIELPKPVITVTAADGDTVNELALDFTPDDAAVPLRFDSADLGKTITLIVYGTLGDYNFDPLTLNPKAFDAATGVLTVSLLDVDGKQGFKLHEAEVTVNGDVLTLFSFRLKFPEGLLTGSEGLRSAASEYDCGALRDVTGIPVRTLGEISYPTWLIDLFHRIVDKTDSEAIHTIAGVIIVTPIFLFGLFGFGRVAFKLYESYALYHHVDPNYFLPYWLASKLFK